VNIGSHSSGVPNVGRDNFIVGKTTGDVNFKGWLENLLIANRALTAAEIASYQTGFSNSVIPGGTVGYWQFNNATNLGADSSGQGNTLVASGNGQWWNGEGLVDGEVAGGVDDFGIALAGNTAVFGVGNPDTTISSTTAINDGQWHHITATRNADTGLMQLYVDGVLQASATGPFGPKPSPPNLRLGSIENGVAGGYFSGVLDDVQIFNRVLSAPEITDVMNQSLTLNSIASTNLIAGQTLVVSNSVVDPYSPPRTVTWSVSGVPAGVAIDPASGVLTWRPTIAQSYATYSFSIIATDSGSPGLSATQYVLVTVLPPATPTINPPASTNGLFTFSVNGDSGPDYYIDSTTNLAPSAMWSPLFTNYAPASFPFAWTDFTATNALQRFYRIRLGP